MYNYIHSMINYHQAADKIDSQFYTEQLLKPENSLRTHGSGFEPVPSDCEKKGKILESI